MPDETPETNLPSLDEDTLHASIDVIGRAGGSKYEVGFPKEVEDSMQVGDPVWYAKAKFPKHGCMKVEGFTDPVAATEALARRLVDGWKCTHCGKRVSLAGRLGSENCRWTRQGPRWVRGCESVGELFADMGASGTLEPKVEGKHRWIVTVGYSISEKKLRLAHSKTRVNLDRENRFSISAGCLDCELSWYEGEGKLCSSEQAPEFADKTRKDGP